MDSLLLPLGILITVKAFRTEIPLAKGRGKKSGITHGNTAGFCTKKVIVFHDSCIRSIYLGRKFNHPVFIVDFRCSTNLQSYAVNTLSSRICHDRNSFIKLMITHKLQFSMALMGYFSP